MTHFIGLRSKAYTYKVHESKDVRKCKGIKFNVVKNKITFEDDYNSLFKGEIICADQTIIRSRAHNLTTETQREVALSPADDKWYLIENSTNTLPWGHYRIINST